MRFLTYEEAGGLIGVNRTTLYRWERQGRFPRRRQIGPNRVGYLASEVEAWMRSRPPVGSEDAVDVEAGGGRGN